MHHFRIEQMINQKDKFHIKYSLLLLFLSFPVFSESSPVFVTNYDVIFTIEKEIIHEKNTAPKVNSRTSRVTKTGVRLISGENIRLHISEKYNIDLKLSEVTPKIYALEVMINGRLGTTWYPIIDEAIRYERELGLPFEFTWKSGEIILDVAIMVNTESP